MLNILCLGSWTFRRTIIKLTYTTLQNPSLHVIVGRPVLRRCSFLAWIWLISIHVICVYVFDVILLELICGLSLLHSSLDICAIIFRLILLTLMVHRVNLFLLDIMTCIVLVCRSISLQSAYSKYLVSYIRNVASLRFSFAYTWFMRTHPQVSYPVSLFWIVVHGVLVVFIHWWDWVIWICVLRVCFERLSDVAFFGQLHFIYLLT